MKHYKLQNCNYILMDEKEKEEFKRRYMKIFDALCGGESVILTVNRSGVYFSMVEDESRASTIFVRLNDFSSGVKEISDLDMKKAISAEGKVSKTAVCGTWNEVDDEIIFRLLNDNVTIRILISALPRKKAQDYVKEKSIKLKEKELSSAKAFTYSGIDEDLLEVQRMCHELREKIMAENKNLYRVKLEVTAYGTDEAEAETNLDKTIKEAKKYGVDLNKTGIKLSGGLLTVFKKSEEAIYTGDIIGALIPFTHIECNAESGLNYGNNAISGQPVVFDRKYCKLPHGFIVSNDKSQRRRIMWNEINQIENDTDNDVVVIDPYGYNKDKARSMKIIDCFGEDSKYHINIMDYYHDEFRESKSELTDVIASFFEGMFERELNAYERNTVARAVYNVINPFDDYLKANNLQYDFNKNPTLKDVLEALERERVEKEPEYKEVRAFAEKIKDVFPQNADEKLKILINSVNNILDGPIVNGMDGALFTDIEKHKNELERFCFATDIPDNTNVYLTLDKNANTSGIESCCIRVFARYAFMRICMNYEKSILDINHRKTTWVYIEDISPWVHKDAGIIFEHISPLIKRTRQRCGIVTIGLSSFVDLLSADGGTSFISNTAVYRIASQTWDSRKEMQKIFRFSDKEIQYLDGETGIFYYSCGIKIPYKIPDEQIV